MTAVRNGAPIPLGGARPRLVLALLAAGRGRTVSVEQLIDGLWPDDPPPRPARASRSMSPPCVGPSVARPSNRPVAATCSRPISTPPASRPWSPEPRFWPSRIQALVSTTSTMHSHCGGEIPMEISPTNRRWSGSAPGSRSSMSRPGSPDSDLSWSSADTRNPWASSRRSSTRCRIARSSAACRCSPSTAPVARERRCAPTRRRDGSSARTSESSLLQPFRSSSRGSSTRTRRSSARRHGPGRRYHPPFPRIPPSWSAATTTSRPYKVCLGVRD